MYRPVVRCDDLYKEYVEKLFHSTFLDRNQIIRLMMFSAPFNSDFQNQIKKYLKPYTSLPSPTFNHADGWLWRYQTAKSALEGGVSGGVTELINNDGGEVKLENSTRHTREVSRQQGQVYESRTECGGIRFSVG